MIKDMFKNNGKWIDRNWGWVALAGLLILTVLVINIINNIPKVK